jgi:Hemerythrin HHE cation binding domain
MRTFFISADFALKQWWAPSSCAGSGCAARHCAKQRLANAEPGFRPTRNLAGCFSNKKMNIFEALRHSHVTQRTLADQLLETSGDSRERDTLFKQLKIELAAHAAAEERCFYVPLIAHDMTQEPSRHGIAEHHEMDELVETLEETDYSSPRWLVVAKALHHKIYHHLEDEEQGIFQLAGKVLTDAQKLSLAKDYEGEFVSQRIKA